MKKLIVVVSVVVVGGLSGHTGAASSVLECSVAALQQKAPAGTTITAAAMVPAEKSTPEYCRVDGHVATPGNTVNFRLGLPAAWNAKFYFAGIGGFGGTFGQINTGLDAGYASASTDTGHQGAITDASWALNNPAKRIDYAYRGTHVTAVATRALSEAYYGAAPKHAYFDGCSNGGRQALLEAQRFPEDFDGIIAGDPSFGTLGQVRRALVYQKLLSSPDHFLSPAKVSLLADAVMKSCDAKDGLTDGLITDPRACTFKPETLKCAGPDGPNCLTSAELETVNAHHGDIKGPLGRTLTHFPLGNEDGTSGWQAWVTGAGIPERRSDGTLALTGRMPAGYSFQNGYLQHLAFENSDGTFDWRTFDVDRDGPKLQPFMDVFSPTSTDLSKLRARGGKLLLYHGWADPALSALNTIAYYEDVLKAAATSGKKDDPSTGSGQGKFVELFMAPGMHHCQGTGPGPNRFDMLSALDAWVDKGTAPSRVIASHSTNNVIDRTRPLCPYPQVAKYKGTGSIDAAENFVCASSESVQIPAAQAPAAQRAGAQTYTPPKTPWGDPDLSGNYTNKYEYGTPFERPQEFAGRRLEDVTSQELADVMKKRQADALERAKFLGGDPEGKIGNSAEFRDIYEVSKGSRAWLVTDPADGRIPAVTPEGRARAAAAARAGSSFGSGPFNGPEDFSMWERCITRGFPGSMLPGVYGNSYQIVQGPGYVAIRYEMIHETRIVRIDPPGGGAPHPSKNIRLDMGDARGHWEGATLVVETTNFSARTAYRNASPATLTLVERFTPKARGAIEWSLTVTDPATWERPWTFAIPLTMNNDERIEQYECHEGNHAVFNILSAARAAERDADAAVKK